MTDEAQKAQHGLLRVLLVLAACLALFVLTSGAIKTSAAIWARLNPAHMQLAQSSAIALAHQYAGSTLFVLILVCVWFALKSGDRILRWLSLGALFAVVCEVFTISLGPLQNATYTAVVHAIFGHLGFACVAAAAIIAMTGNRDQQTVIAVSGGFPLATLAYWIPPLVLTQVAMGALYRHDLWSVMPHMAGAMLVAFLLVSEGVILLQRVPEHRILRRVAVWSIALVLTQISLGIADFLVRLLDFADSVVWLTLSIAHVTVAALTFTASLCLSISVRAYVSGSSSRN